MPNYYQVLEISPTASSVEARQAYLRLAKAWHPDLHQGSPEALRRFQEIQQAYRVLASDELRGAYDEFLHGFEDEGHQQEARARLDDFAQGLMRPLELALSLAEALNGCTRRLSIEGREIEVLVPAPVENGQILSAEGFRFRLCVKVPQRLSRRQKKILADFARFEDPSAYPRRQDFLRRIAHAA
jgi:DnaJ-class molecular chaperone